MSEITAKPLHRNIEYLPPEREGIDRYAKQVCDQLAERYDDPSYREGEVVHGLADFLDLAGKIQAKHFNSSESVDNHSSEG